jgi:hypothetical protein
VTMGFALAAVWLTFAVRRWERNQKKPAVSRPSSLGRAYRSLDVSTLVLFALIPLKDGFDIWLDTEEYKRTPIPPAKWPIRYDSITDVLFWWSGMFAGAILIGAYYQKDLKGWWRTRIPIVLCGICFGFAYFLERPVWLDQKRTFDASGLPFNYTRLPVLAAQPPGEGKVELNPNSPVQWPELKDFRDAVSGDERPAPRHYVIFGGTPAQRSKLAVSMGCEYALALRKPRPKDWQTDFDKADESGKAELTKLLLRRVRYVTAPAVLERSEQFQEYLHRAVVECIVIDDLSVATSLTGGGLNAPELVDRAKLTPEQVLELERRIESDRKRKEKYDKLGQLVRGYQIGTVWVLTGDRTLPAWDDDRKRWLNEIAKLVADGDRKAVLEIHLADPK